MLIGFDHFAEATNTLGPLAAREVIVECASRLEALSVPPADGIAPIVGRVGPADLCHCLRRFRLGTRRARPRAADFRSTHATFHHAWLRTRLLVQHRHDAFRDHAFRCSAAD
ncbi:hypothetical protein ACU4HD_43270 [Cupriavidus basilensis]